jgi:hypothetical protein
MTDRSKQADTFARHDHVPVSVDVCRMRMSPFGDSRTQSMIWVVTTVCGAESSLPRISLAPLHGCILTWAFLQEAELINDDRGSP